ncbi:MULTISPECIES: DUF488 domain-containing protein [Streptomyces]|uniref:DUF488 family protein n=2 Tax=Streptomyces TaxID=1883 RepID=A0A420V519_9ACTN|nr:MULTISPECIES: DUF488 family protein [Streptomyces]KNE80259.1 hypothetical protein ADZ36_23115 [Streptomyces fradiae]OFA46605.1 hypothetical protein BEN35_21180 [Streptomyces fradiae]PQM22491.1 DUF488 domain-containing protein [Streptomyces xinghaiensis]RKM96542.1 DUF488 family protein [Streptomyces xinghaiensis]RNC74306.1 DUF488 family protein [Streptomyces xinghaiensis]
MAGRRVVRVRRVYEDREPDDGARVLVDRLWPRGLAKEAAGLDEWCKEAAPSSELRRWYGHDPERFEEFSERYRAELAEPERREVLDRLRGLARGGGLTLLTATKDVERSAARVLERVLADGR